MINDREFIIYLKKYIPTKSHKDEAIDFNMKQLHLMIEEYLKKIKK